MIYKIIDNFLPNEKFEEIVKIFKDENFPWNFSFGVSNLEENLPVNASYYFTNEFWNKYYVKPQYQIFTPILDFLEYKAIMRIKANLYPSTETIVHHDNHIDYEFSHRGAIFYLNTNNGLTVLEDTIEIKSIENRLLLFDPSKPHRSTTCTDDKCRVNVNFNFF